VIGRSAEIPQPAGIEVEVRKPDILASIGVLTLFVIIQSAGLKQADLLRFPDELVTDRDAGGATANDDQVCGNVVRNI